MHGFLIPCNMFRVAVMLETEYTVDLLCGMKVKLVVLGTKVDTDVY